MKVGYIQVFLPGIPIRCSTSTTWVIWNYLLHPVDHPLFRRMLRTPIASTSLSKLLWSILLIGALLGCGLWAAFLQAITQSVFAGLLAVIFLSSNIYIVVWVTNISAAIARTHENGTYDQFAATLLGALGMNLAICVAVLHRNEAITWINFSRQLLTGMFLLIFLMFLMVAALHEPTLDVFRFLRFFLDIIGFVTAAYLDHIQATVLGCLIGMLVPLYRRTSADAPILAAGVFLALQLTILLATLFVITAAIPMLYRLLPVTGWLSEISPPLLCLLMFYLIRETFNTVMWRTLAYQLRVDSTEFELVSLNR